MQSANNKPPRLTALIAAGVISWCLYAGFSWLSRDFALADGVDRPILAAVSLLVMAFACYFLALRTAIKADGHRDLIPTILIFAAGFRATLLFSQPFQEIDIYRYVWDGEVVVSGVNPFRYSPEDVLSASAGYDLPNDLRKLVTLRDSDPALKAVLETVHFKRLPTVYPATSQAVFAAAAATTPHDASVATRLSVMKAWLLLFDFASLGLLIAILKRVGKPVGWAVAYGWCPLVLKEFANSGHLDSIAVFFTVLAIWCVLRGWYPRQEQEPGEPTAVAGEKPKRPLMWGSLAALALGLAIGAKLYPVVLTPLLFFTAIRRGGWLVAVSAAVLAGGIATGLLWPLFDREDIVAAPVPESQTQRPRGPVVIVPPIPPGGVAVPAQLEGTAPIPVAALRADAAPHDPSQGLKAFLTQWKMNDFLFLIVIENLTPRDQSPPKLRPWFAITPEAWRQRGVEAVRDGVNFASKSLTGKPINIRDRDVPFLLARGITATGFLSLALWWSWRAGRDDSAQRFLEIAFLTLAWFWLLLPTLNPWYWIWALPLVPFARSRAWLAMSGLVLMYYLRFWFAYHHAGEAVWHTPYEGATFFDYVIIWLEFGPWFLWLIVDAVRRR